jgi:hypothetical protein
MLQVKIILLILYGCETWSLTLREGYRLRVFENMVMIRIFGPTREEVEGGWRRLHNELHNLYTPPNIMRVIKSRRMKYIKHVACMGRYLYKILVRKPRCRWEDNIRMCIRVIGWEVMN